MESKHKMKYFLLYLAKGVTDDTSRNNFSRILVAEFKCLRKKIKQMNEENKLILSFQEVRLYGKKGDKYLET